MTATFPLLGDLTLIQTAYTGFGYPVTPQVVPLLGDGTTPGGNAAVQQSALTLRQATVSWVATNPADVETARAYSETLEVVSYTDHDGDARDVRVLAFASQVRVGDYWDCTATLIEAA